MAVTRASVIPVQSGMTSGWSFGSITETLQQPITVPLWGLVVGALVVVWVFKR